MTNKIEVRWPNWIELINPTFIPLIKNTDRYLICYGGRGSSKSDFAAKKLIFRCLSENYFRCILMRNSYNSIKDSSYDQLKITILDLGLGDLFEFKLQPLEIICKVNGNKFIARGCDDTTKLKSIKDFSAVWWEEDIPSEDDFITVTTSIRTTKADYLQEIFTINPEVEGVFQDHWFWKRFFNGHLEKSFRDVKVVKLDNDETAEITYTCHHCFIGETMVYTEDGYKRIDSIKVGTKVMTRDGFKPVIKWFNNGIREVRTYKINNKIITCTPSHKFYTKEFGFKEISFLSSLQREITFLLYNKKGIWEEKKLFITELVGSIKENIIRREEVYDLMVEDCHEFLVEDILVSNSTYRDNKWIPNGFIAYLIQLRNNNPYYYDTYCEGNWGNRQIGGLAYKKFMRSKSCYRDITYNPDLALHISFDFNVKPYMSMTVWQIEGKIVKCIDCIASKTPDNTTSGICKEFMRRYYLHKAGLFVYGDPSGANEDTKMENGFNNYSIIEQELHRYRPTIRVATKHPPVAMRLNFINTIFDVTFNDINILISESASELIMDLMFQKENADGTKMKEKTTKNGDTYEKYGHMSDSMDYFLCEAFADDFDEYQFGKKISFYVNGSSDDEFNPRWGF